MKRIDKPSVVTQLAAEQLLEQNMEMLHSVPEGEGHCMYCGKWRAHISFDEECPALLRAAIGIIREREQQRCSRICVKEYERWKDVDVDSYGIAVGAIGAASNILCAIEGFPAVADPPVHGNEESLEQSMASD